MGNTNIIHRQEKDTLLGKEVMQSNIITSGKFDYTACQLDILFMLLANLNEKDDTYIIRVKDIELITGRIWNYQQFKDATYEMLGRVFEYEDKRNDEFVQMVLFQYFKYIQGSGLIEVKLSDMAKPLFFNLKSNFTLLQLKSVLGCSSKYAKRIYAFCCQWRSVGFKEYSIKEFKEMLGLINNKTGEEQYKQIGEFKKYVLERSKEQINKFTNVRFHYELKKLRSRSFDTLIIYINQPTTEQLKIELSKSDIDFNKSIEEQKNIKIIMAYGLTEKQAQKVLSNGTIEQFEQTIKEINKSIKNNPKQLENSIGYIYGALQNKGLL